MRGKGFIPYSTNKYLTVNNKYNSITSCLLSGVALYSLTINTVSYLGIELIFKFLDELL